MLSSIILSFSANATFLTLTEVPFCVIFASGLSWVGGPLLLALPTEETDKTADVANDCLGRLL